MIFRGLPIFIAIAAVIPAALSAQNSSAAPANLTAREIFYSSDPAPGAAAKPQSTARKRPARPSAQKSVETERDTAVSSGGSHTGVVPQEQQAKIVNAADHPARALGLRYTLLKVSGGSAEPVGIHSIFRSGDRIRINVEVNDLAYLYVVSRGSSGTWSPLFPSKDVDDGSNRVEPGRTYEIPPRHVIAFREPSGSERLFIVASREPEPSLEKLIYSMNKSGSGGTGGSPAGQPPSGGGTKILMASAHIGDDTVGGLRAYSRDLIVEDANEASSNGSDGAGAGEKSVYVVNPTGSADSRVVAEISLNHQ